MVDIVCIVEVQATVPFATNRVHRNKRYSCYQLAAMQTDFIRYTCICERFIDCSVGKKALTLHATVHGRRRIATAGC